MSLDVAGIHRFSMGHIHCSHDSQVQNSANITLKLGSTTLFIYLKIILLQCFQFLTISSIQTDPKSLTTLRFLAQKTKTTKRSDELHFYRERQDKYNF